jgi:hypothetical protein
MSSEAAAEAVMKKPLVILKRRYLHPRPENDSKVVELLPEDVKRYSALSSYVRNIKSKIQIDALSYIVSSVFKECDPEVQKYISARVFAEFDYNLGDVNGEYICAQLAQVFHITIHEDWLWHKNNVAALAILQETLSSSANQNTDDIVDWIIHYVINNEFWIFPLPWDPEKTTFFLVTTLFDLLGDISRTSILKMLLELKQPSLMLILGIPYLAKYEDLKVDFKFSMNNVRNYCYISSELITLSLPSCKFHNYNCLKIINDLWPNYSETYTLNINIKNIDRVVAWYNNFFKSMPEEIVQEVLADRWKNPFVFLDQWTALQKFYPISKKGNSIKDFLKNWQRIWPMSAEAHIIKFMMGDDPLLHDSYTAKFNRIVREAIDSIHVISLQDMCHLRIILGTLTAKFSKGSKEKVQKYCIGSIPLAIQLIYAFASVHQSYVRNSEVIEFIPEWLNLCKSSIWTLNIPMILRQIPELNLGTLFPDLHLWPILRNTLLRYETHSAFIAALLRRYFRMTNTHYALEKYSYHMITGVGEYKCSFNFIREQIKIVVAELCPQLSDKETEDKTLRIIDKLKTTVEGQGLINRILKSLKEEDMDLIRISQIVMCTGCLLDALLLPEVELQKFNGCFSDLRPIQKLFA